MYFIYVERARIHPGVLFGRGGTLRELVEPCFFVLFPASTLAIALVT